MNLRTFNSEATVDAPEEIYVDLTWSPTSGNGASTVILYNCDCHSFMQAVVQIMKATRCSHARAEAVALEAHISGRAIAYSGEREECERVAEILGSTGLQVEVDSF